MDDPRDVARAAETAPWWPLTASLRPQMTGPDSLTQSPSALGGDTVWVEGLGKADRSPMGDEIKREGQGQGVNEEMKNGFRVSVHSLSWISRRNDSLMVTVFA